MKIQHIVYLFLMFTIPLSLPAQNLDSVEGDYQALMDLYESTGGDNWDDNTGWGGDASTMGSWTGVETNSEGRVVRVDLLRVSDIGEGSGGTIYTGNNLTGTLPESIGNLKKCIYFNVKQNNLSGKIPDGIGFMEDLEFLHLGGQRWDPGLDNSSWNSHNHTHGLDPDGKGKNSQETNEFSGELPKSIGNLNKLKVLEIRRQFLTGRIPNSIGGLTKLVGLFLNEQKTGTFGGELPPEIGNQVNLKHLHLQYNNFSGQIPFQVLDMAELRFIRLNSNNFSGSLPEFTAAYDIRYITFAKNNFTGGFPTWLFNQGKNPILNAFNISFNKLTGPLPDINPSPDHPSKEEMGFDNYHSMTIFSISYNDFEGPVPDWILSMSAHTQVKLQNNNLSGEFKKQFISGQHPDAIQGSSNNSWGGRIRLFEFDNNNFSGELPDAEWVSNVLYIRMGGNNFTGSIPESWESLKNGSRLSMFRLENNELSGEIPRWIGELEKLNRLGLENNRFTFSDILPHFDFINNNIDDFRYYPQKSFGEVEQITIEAGNTFRFDYSHRVHPDDEVQWIKNGVPIEGETTPVLSISGVGFEDAGTYKLELRNPNLPELGTLVSEPIELRIGDGGSSSISSPSVPQLSSPSNGAAGVTTSPTLSWNPADNAESYRLQVSPAGGSFSPIIDEPSISSTSFGASGLEYETEYSWRVLAINESGTSSWSQIWTFTTSAEDTGGETPVLPAPEKISPEQNASDVNTTLSFAWTAVEADEYILHVSREDESGSHQEFFYSDNEGVAITNTEITLSNATTTGRRHYWRVRGVKDGIEGEWSPVWQFSTETVQDEGSGGNNGNGPQKSTPAKDEKNVSKKPTFKWESVEDADSYTIQVSSTETSEILIEEQVYDTLYTPGKEFQPNQKYQWRVRAIGIGVEDDEWSDTWDFTTTSDESELAAETELNQNYPNPFNPSTQIRFSISEQQQVSLKVYDMSGRLVANLVDNTAYPAGSHEVTFNANSLASGIYFYRFITGSEIITRKMTLMK